jgi:AcrR family transcriptional regulator
VTRDTQQHIFNSAKRIFAERGYDGLSMRTLAREVGISLSSIYHYYPDKDVLLKDIFDSTNTTLGRERSKLPQLPRLEDALLQRISFQFDHIEDVVFVLKYYLHNRSDFQKQAHGWVPEKASLHIEEILSVAQANKELRPSLNIAAEAKMITHMINGFLLEYYPATPKGQEKQQLIRHLQAFILRSITTQTATEVPMHES